MIDEGAQADIPEPDKVEEELKIRPLERITLHPKVPIEPSAYGKGKNFSRPWILQDGREVPRLGSEMRDCYRIPKKAKHGEGKSVESKKTTFKMCIIVHKRWLKIFFYLLTHL